MPKHVTFKVDRKVVDLIRSNEEVALFVLMAIRDTNNITSITHAVFTGFSAFLNLQNVTENTEIAYDKAVDFTSEFRQFIPSFSKMLFETFDSQIADIKERAKAKEAVDLALAA